MREIRQSGSEGGGASLRSPYPYQRPVEKSLCYTLLTPVLQGGLIHCHDVLRGNLRLDVVDGTEHVSAILV